MANRVAAAIERTRTKLATLSPERRAALDKNLDLTFHEHFEYQQQQAYAHAAGKLTTAEAQIVYAALGEVGSQQNGGWAARTDLATKVVVTQLIGELVGAGHRRTRVPAEVDGWSRRRPAHPHGRGERKGIELRLTRRSGRRRYRGR